MKKIKLILMLSLTVVTAFSQKMDDINEMIGKNQFNEARFAIDKYLLNPKKSSDAEGGTEKG